MGYFDELTEGDVPVARTVTYRGKEKQVWFRRITGAERLALTKGQMLKVGDGKGSTELDLGMMNANRHLLVRFSCVTEEGKQVFNGLPEVQKLPAALVDELANHAQSVNDGDDAGNA